MCLTKVSFTLDENGVGVGYKLLPAEAFDSKGRFNTSLSKQKGWSKEWKKIEPRKQKINARDKQEYVPGYHIFLNKEDARNYRHSYSDSVLVKVEFRGIMTLGTNETTRDEYGPCIVAKEMRVVEIIGQRGNL